MLRTSPKKAREQAAGTGSPRSAGAPAACRRSARRVSRGLAAVVAALGLAVSGLAAAGPAGASTTAPAGPAAGCTRTVTGTHRGGLVAGSGVLCLRNATQLGPVRVWHGAGLRVSGSVITGAVTVTRTRLVQVCGSRLDGSFRADRAAGPVTVGGGASCRGDVGHGRMVISRSAGPVQVAGLRQQGPAVLSGNAAGVTLSGASVGGKVTVRGNRGSAPVVVTADTIAGSLACAANRPAPVDRGRLDTVSGTAGGQCSGLVPVPPRKGTGPPLAQDLSSTLPGLNYGQAVGNFVFDGTDHDQLAYYHGQDNALKIANASKYGGGVLQSAQTDLQPLPDLVSTRDYPWNHQPDLVDGLQVAASASNIYMAGATYDCADCAGMQLHLYKLPHDGSCAQPSCAIATVDLSGFSPSDYPRMVTALTTGVVGGQTIIALAVSDYGILLYDDNLHLITVLTDFGPQDEPPDNQVAATALAFGPPSGPGQGGLLVAAVANADTQTLLNPLAGWHLNPDGTEKDLWQFDAGASWDPTWMDLGVTVAQVGDEPAAVYTRTDGDVIVVNADNGSLITDLPDGQRTGLPLGVTAVPSLGDDPGNEDLVVGMNSGTGDKVLQDVGNTLVPVPFGVGGATTGTDAQVYAWFPGYGAGTLSVFNASSGPVDIAMASRPDPGFGCWLNTSVAQPRELAFPTSDAPVDARTQSPDYFIGALTAGVNGDCASAQGKGERNAYVIITPAGDQADEHIVKLVVGLDGTPRIADQVGGYLTARLRDIGEGGSWGTWQMDVSGGVTPRAAQEPTVTGVRLTSAPGPNYQPPAISPADDPCRPVFRFDVTGAIWTELLAPGEVTARIPAMTAQGSTDGRTWQDLGQLMPSSAPALARGQVTLGPASFYFQNRAGTAVAPGVEPAGQHQCPATGDKPVILVRVVSGVFASRPVALAGLAAPPVSGGPGATPVQGISATPDTAGGAAPRADGVDQAGLTLKLVPSGSGGEIDPSDPRYQLVYYRVADTHALITGLYQAGDYADYTAVGPYAADGSAARPTHSFLATTNTASQSLNAVLNDSGAGKGITSGALPVAASSNPLTASGTATGGIGVTGCASGIGAGCVLGVPGAVPVLYQAGGPAAGPVTGLQFTATAITGRASLPLQVGTANVHQLGSASLDVTPSQAKLLDTSQFFPTDTIDTALVTSGELVPALNIHVGDGN
jgi:hypothetical protein